MSIGGASLSDTLGRIWENDIYYFYHPINSSTSSDLVVSTNPAAIKYSIGAPPLVYATARTLKM